MSTNIQLVIVDDQYDFMDNADSALPVPGGNDDADLVAQLIRTHGQRFADIHVTLDSHHPLDVGHATMWRDANGKPPAPFTAITAADIEQRIWTPRNENARPPVLGGQTIREYFLAYARQLEAAGEYTIFIWPQHCLIGTPGHNVQVNLAAALKEWEEKQFAVVNYVTKGSNPWTEHYGALEAEVPMANDPSTTLNTNFLTMLSTADKVIFTGEALTHCVLKTLKQVVYGVDPALVQKFTLLTDCTSPIPAAPGGPDFPAIARNEIDKMVKLGLKLLTSTDLF